MSFKAGKIYWNYIPPEKGCKVTDQYAASEDPEKILDLVHGKGNIGVKTSGFYSNSVETVADFYDFKERIISKTFYLG